MKMFCNLVSHDPICLTWTCFSSSCMAPSITVYMDSPLGKIHPLLQQLQCFVFHSVYTNFKHHVTPVCIYMYSTVYRPLSSMLHDMIKTSISNQNYKFMFFFHSWMMMLIMIQTCLHIVRKNLCKWWKKNGVGEGWYYWISISIINVTYT